MRKKLWLGLILVLFLPATILGLADKTFSGTGDKTTDTFECHGKCKITWETEAEFPKYADFYVFIEKVGADYSLETFEGWEGGTTYLYDTGTFYFKVICANLRWWEIRVEEKAVSEFAPILGFISGFTVCPVFAGIVVIVLWVKRRR